MGFCEWLSGKTKMKITLPTEAEWEWACRAGSATSMWYGDIDDDFTQYANLADMSLKTHLILGFGLPAGALHEWRPSISHVNDRARVSAENEFCRKNYKPNPWGLFNMHGNVAEWTLSQYRDYPYKENDRRNDPSPGKERVARGGSWYERPKHATATFRQPYQEFQKVYNVGFRIICRE
jgi:formylglycine-generating enzyme required for sulfatase activity